MSPAARSSLGWLAASVLVAGAASPSRLAAQGGEQSRRSTGFDPAAGPERSHLAPARSILGRFVGTWRFEIWFAGNLDGAADASGVRVVRSLYDDLRIEWTEELDHSAVRGQGIMGFDARSNRFFSTAFYSAGSAPELLSGRLDHLEPRITFHPLAPAAANPAAGGATGAAAPPAGSVELTMLDRNHFTWAALDRGWRTVFTRVTPDDRGSPDAGPAP